MKCYWKKMVLKPSSANKFNTTPEGFYPAALGRALSNEPDHTKLVEARGVEPLSEDRQRTGSTCVAERFTFATTHARRQA
jgi:hypothetical protein